jgi:hypothetical protein
MTDPEFITELKSILAAEVKCSKLDTLQEGDYTVYSFMEEHDITKNTARRILDKIFREGRFIKVKVPNPNGGRVSDRLPAGGEKRGMRCSSSASTAGSSHMGTWKSASSAGRKG